MDSSKNISLYKLSKEIIDIERSISQIDDNYTQLDSVLQHLKKVEFYATASFDADESCQWIISVHLDLYGENGCELNLVPYKSLVKNEQKLGYDEWKNQMELDRPAAMWDLTIIAEKWGCKIR